MKEKFFYIRSMATALVMLAVFVAVGQPAAIPDSLRKTLMTDLDERARMNTYRDLGMFYVKAELFDSSILYCDSAVKMAMSLGDKAAQAEINTTLGNALFYSAGPEEGLKPYNESYRLYSQIGDSAGIARALNGMGVMYKKMGQYDSAVSCFMHLVRLAEKNNYEETLGMAYLNLGILYEDMLESERANHYLDLSMPINEKYRPDLVAMALMNKGMIHHGLNEKDSALIRYRQASAIYYKLDRRKNLADLYNNIGNLFIDTTFSSYNSDSAYNSYIRAKDIYEELGDGYTFCQVYYNMARVMIIRGNVDQALNTLDSCINVARQYHNTELESMAYKKMAEVYRIKGRHLLALESYFRYDSIRRIIYNLEKEKLIADLEMKYQNEKKQAQILALERDYLKKTKQNNVYLFSALAIISIILFAFLYFRQQTVKDRIISQQKIRQLEEEKKLLAAKALVEGQEEERKRVAREIHDGLGVLLSTTKMQFSVIQEKSPENQEIINKAIKLLEQASADARKISHNMMPGLLTKLGLFEAIGDLFDKLAETEGLQVNVEIPEDEERLPENKEIMIYRIIQELVNNTLKHAQAKSIAIKMHVYPDRLDILYTDDGKGFEPADQDETKSLGLTGIKSRLNFLNGKLEFHSEPGKGVSYKLEIPV